MSELDDYLKGYCRKERVSVEEAKTHAIVQEVAKYYDDLDTGKISVAKMDIGCGGAEIGGDCK